MPRESSVPSLEPLDLWAQRADGFGMPRDDQRPHDLLAFCVEPRSVDGLRTELEAQGMRVDLAQSLCDMRSAFFLRGGHDLLVIAPDVPTQLAERAVVTLRDLDPDVAVIAFGREPTNATLPSTVTRLPEIHPTSRAGIGAVLRVVLGLG